MKPRRAAIIHRGMHERSAEKKESASIRPIIFQLLQFFSSVFLDATAAHASTQDDVNQAVTNTTVSRSRPRTFSRAR